MTAKQKEMAALLLQPGTYIRTRMNNNGDLVYVVYKGNQVALRSYDAKTGAALKNFF